MATLKCDMDASCTDNVTYIDDKGFAYCTKHGLSRREYRPCRQLQPFEIGELKAGRTIRYALATRASVLAAAQRKWGDVEAFGHLNTIGRNSGPYRRDGQKEFHAIVRPCGARDASQFLVNVTAPTAGQAWAEAMTIIEGA